MEEIRNTKGGKVEVTKGHYTHMASVIASDDPERVWRKDEIAQGLKVDPWSNDYKFAFWEMIKYLKRQYGIWLVSVKGVGHRVASDREKADDLFRKKQQRIYNTMKDQAECLRSVNVQELDKKTKMVHEHHTIKNGMLRAAFTMLEVPKHKQIKMSQEPRALKFFIEDGVKKDKEKKDEENE